MLVTGDTTMATPESGETRGTKRKAVEITTLEGETETLEIMPLGWRLAEHEANRTQVPGTKWGGLAF